MVEAVFWSFSGVNELEALGPRFVPKAGVIPSITGAGFASDELTATLITTSPLRVIRGTWGDDKSSVLNFCFLVDGLVRMTRPDTKVLLRPGSIFYQPGLATMTTESTTSARILQLSLPRVEMSRYGFDTEAGLYELDPDERSTQAAFAYATTFALTAGDEAGLPSDSEVDIFAHVVKQLLVSAFLFTRGAQRGKTNVRAVTVAGARTVIERTHRSLACTPETVAKAVNVSLRSLQRLFGDAGTTVASEIERARVASAIEVLRGRPKTKLEMVAATSGFSCSDHLRRALKRREGLTPSDVRGRTPAHPPEPVEVIDPLSHTPTPIDVQLINAH